jgi:hypothetical protein
MSERLLTVSSNPDLTPIQGFEPEWGALAEKASASSTEGRASQAISQ